MTSNILSDNISKKKKDVHFEGATVLEPHLGFHEKPVELNKGDYKIEPFSIVSNFEKSQLISQFNKEQKIMPKYVFDVPMNGDMPHTDAEIKKNWPWVHDRAMYPKDRYEFEYKGCSCLILLNNITHCWKGYLITFLTERYILYKDIHDETITYYEKLNDNKLIIGFDTSSDIIIESIFSVSRDPKKYKTFKCVEDMLQTLVYKIKIIEYEVMRQFEVIDKRKMFCVLTEYESVNSDYDRPSKEMYEKYWPWTKSVDPLGKSLCRSNDTIQSEIFSPLNELQALTPLGDIVSPTFIQKKEIKHKKSKDKCKSNIKKRQAGKKHARKHKQ